MDLEFKFEKDTKNTYRYQEVAPEGEEKIGTLYVKKSALANKAPAKLTVTVKAG